MEQIDIMPKREGSGPQGTAELLSLGQPLLDAATSTPVGKSIVDIMEKKEGSGHAGTMELLSLSAPVLAVLGLTPVGRGVIGAIGTVSLASTDVEAGTFGILPGIFKGAPKLVSKGAAIFPDRTRNIEFATNTMRSFIDKNGRLNLQNLADTIKTPNLSLLEKADQKAIHNMKTMFSKVPVETRTQIQMLKTPTITEGTGAFFNPPDKSFGLPYGKVVLRHSDKNRVDIPSSDMASGATHEFTHSGDTTNTITRKIMKETDKRIEYNFALTENRAFMAGSRNAMDESLTGIGSKDLLHPMLSYGGGKISIAPGLDYMSNIRHSYKKIGQPVDEAFIDGYKELLIKEQVRMQKKVNAEPAYRYKLDMATKDMTDADMKWVFNNPQKMAHSRRQASIKEASSLMLDEPEKGKKLVRELYKAVK